MTPRDRKPGTGFVRPFVTCSLLAVACAGARAQVFTVGEKTATASIKTDFTPTHVELPDAGLSERGRRELVRDLEAARRLAGGKAWATLLISDVPLTEGSDAAVAASIAAGAPHLDAAGRAELQAGYLGNLTWAQAASATGLELAALPHVG